MTNPYKKVSVQHALRMAESILRKQRYTFEADYCKKALGVLKRQKKSKVRP